MMKNVLRHFKVNAAPGQKKKKENVAVTVIHENNYFQAPSKLDLPVGSLSHTDLKPGLTIILISQPRADIIC